MKKNIIKTNAIFLALSFLHAGCGGADPDKPVLGRVSGRVNYKGKPLETGLVTFIPSGAAGAATGQTASGEIGTGGNYSLTTFEPGDGAVLGPHDVIVQAREGAVSTGKGMPAPGEIVAQPRSLIPEKYGKAATSGLRFEVKAGSNTYDIDLTE